MACAQQPIRQFLLFILTACLISGCAAGPSRAPSSTGSVSTGPEPRHKALQAIETEDYEQAVRLLEKIPKDAEEMQGDLLYNYGLALGRTGRYEEAIKHLTAYANIRNPRGAYFHEALAERELAAEKLHLQRKEEDRVRTVETHLSEQLKTINQNWQIVQQQTQAGSPSITEPLTGMEMILITGGCYLMGDLFGVGEPNELPVHEVCVEDFYLGKYEVTQGQWEKIMGYNPSAFQKGASYPVETVSWQEAVEFTKYLSGTGGKYRLPTEAEWEYAARSGGLEQNFSGSDNAEEVSWHEGNSEQSTHPVGQRQPNGLGLYDMSGNVYEWCLDRYDADYYRTSPKQNPTGAVAGNKRTRRGGSWDSEMSDSRTSYRAPRHETDDRHYKTGFRLALPVR